MELLPTSVARSKLSVERLVHAFDRSGEASISDDQALAHRREGRDIKPLSVGVFDDGLTDGG